MAKKKVTNEKFVEAWMVSADVKEVAERIGLTTASVYNKSNRLRKAGVKLPYLGYGRINVDALNAIITKETTT